MCQSVRLHACCEPSLDHGPGDTKGCGDCRAPSAHQAWWQLRDMGPRDFSVMSMRLMRLRCASCAEPMRAHVASEHCTAGMDRLSMYHVSDSYC